MILDALWGIFSTVITGVLSVLPDIEPPDLTGAVEAIDGIAAYTGWLNKYFPVTEAIALLALVMSVWVAMQVVKFTLWLIGKIPVFGTG